MTIGAGITLIVIGLILLLGVIEVDIPYVDEYALGVLLALAGIAGIVLSLTVWRNRSVTTYPEGRTTRVVERHVERDVDRPFCLIAHNRRRWAREQAQASGRRRARASASGRAAAGRAAAGPDD
jgi:hypothetical protein